MIKVGVTSLFLLAASAISATSSASCEFSSPYPAERSNAKYHLSDFIDFQDAITRLNCLSHDISLVINETANVTMDTQINSNITIEFAGSFGQFYVTGDSLLSINGPLIAPKKQIFDPRGNSSIEFGQNAPGSDNILLNDVFKDQQGKYVTTAYPQWWGAKADWTNDGVDNDHDNSYAINAAMRSGAKIIEFPAGAYYTHETIISVPPGVGIIRGAGKGVTRLVYSGTARVLDIRASVVKVQDIAFETSDSLAIGIYVRSYKNPDSFNSATQTYDDKRLSAKTQFENVDIRHIANNNWLNEGAGFLFDGSEGWIGGIDLDNIRISMFKFGLKTVGNPELIHGAPEAGDDTVTTIVGKNVWLEGLHSTDIATQVDPETGIETTNVVINTIADSAGIHTDQFSNGVANIITGGTIEGFETGIKVEEGYQHGMGKGFSYRGDFEWVNNLWSVGKTFSGEIFDLNNGNYIKQGANAKAHLWFSDTNREGKPRTHYNYLSSFQDFRVAEAPAWWGARDASSLNNDNLADANQHIGGFTFAEDNGVQKPQHNYIHFRGNKLLWHTAAPTEGHWSVGDRVFNANPAHGQPKGWICIEAGEPGTWVSEGNL